MVEWCKSRWFWTFPALQLSPRVSPGRPLCSWESHGSISNSILGVWQSAAVWVTLRKATPYWHGAPQGQTPASAWKEATSRWHWELLSLLLGIVFKWPSNYFSTYSLPTFFFFSQLKQIVKLKIPRILFSRSLYWYLLLLCPSRDKDYHLRTYKSVVMANKLIDWLIAQVSSFAASQMLLNKNTSC